MSVADERPLRADARRNREAVVKAARAVFARDGKAAQMDDVARRAKVGVGTVYRHFPTKEALLAAIADDRFDDIASLATAALEIEDAWEAFTSFMSRCAALNAADRALSQMLIERPEAMRAAASANTQLQSAVGELIARAQAAGTLRSDFETQDVGLVMCAISSVATKGWGGPGWERMLALVFDGLRAEARRTPLPS
jgi:AcrR family transcriptional regulator